MTFDKEYSFMIAIKLQTMDRPCLASLSRSSTKESKNSGGVYKALKSHFWYNFDFVGERLVRVMEGEQIKAASSALNQDGLSASRSGFLIIVKKWARFCPLNHVWAPAPIWTSQRSKKYNKWRISNPKTYLVLTLCQNLGEGKPKICSFLKIFGLLTVWLCRNLLQLVFLSVLN